MSKLYRCNGCDIHTKCRFDFDKMMCDGNGINWMLRRHDGGTWEERMEGSELEWTQPGVECQYEQEELYKEYLIDKEMDEAIRGMLSEEKEG